MQDYIENENGRLEREQQFWSKEIVVKIEYKYCPNLTIIDTPGAPSAHVVSTQAARSLSNSALQKLTDELSSKAMLQPAVPRCAITGGLRRGSCQA